MTDMIEIDGKQYWPCGCVSWAEEETFYLKACNDPNCSIVRITHEESRKRGNEIKHYRLEDLKE